MNIPNTLSLLRLTLIPVFILIFFLAPDSRWFAGIIVMVSGLTDILDGHIARKYNMITALGRVLDPLADKLTQISAFVCAAVTDLIPWWAVILFVAKELFMLICGAIIFSRYSDVPPSNYFGKFSALFFFVITIAIIMFPMQYAYTLAMVIAALALNYAALAIYFVTIRVSLRKGAMKRRK